MTKLHQLLGESIANPNDDQHQCVVHTQPSKAYDLISTSTGSST